MEWRSARGEGVTMLIARPTTLAGIFDALDELSGAHHDLHLNRISVRPDDIVLSAEQAAADRLTRTDDHQCVATRASRGSEREDHHGAGRRTNRGETRGQAPR